MWEEKAQGARSSSNMAAVGSPRRKTLAETVPVVGMGKEIFNVEYLV